MNKISTLVFGFFLLGGTIWAQTPESDFGVDRVKTIENASSYSAFLEQKNYKAAMPGWRYVFNNAPKFQLSTYLSGEEILVGMYMQTQNKAYIDTLMIMYDQQIKYFGDHPRYGKGYILGKKGFDLYRFGRDDDKTLKEAYSNLFKSFELEGERMNPNSVGALFSIANKVLMKNFISRDEYLNLYTQLVTYVDNARKYGSKSDLATFNDLKNRMDDMLLSSGIADCATLDKLLTAKYQASKEDVANLKEISSMLSWSECADRSLYATVAEQLYKLEPSENAAYNLAMMFLKRQDMDMAEFYLKEAIDKAESNNTTIDYNLRLAQIKLLKGRLPETKAHVMQVLSVNPNNGQALIILGKAYVAYSKKYGEDDFDHASVFWVAVDKFQKAKQVDPTVADEANQLIATYSQYFPRKEEAFFRSVTPGTWIKLGDWINEMTIARFR